MSEWIAGRFLKETHERDGVGIIIKGAMGGWVVIVPSGEDRLGPFGSLEEAKGAALNRCAPTSQLPPNARR